ncbi:MAG TPA: cytochrome c oxidase assembly protein [Miltoncostaeaceae bacterium]|nr:cytochrome c oxidase assembly protein [Miltoncostaeaceae bacterium]
MSRRPLLFLAAGATLALLVALTALNGGRFTSYAGYEQVVRTEPGRWWTLWALPPVEVLAILGLAVGVGAWSRRLGRPLDTRRRVYLGIGVALLLVSVCSPLGGLAQGGILSAHMMQHTIIGAFAPLPVLLALPRHLPEHGGRIARSGVVRVLTMPHVAFSLWFGGTLVFLIPALHHAVLDHQPLWVAQQFAFFGFGLMLWIPILERGVSAPAWFGTGLKCAYMVGVWFAGLAIANLLWFSGTAFYESHAVAAQVWGLNPLADQANAGTVMMVTHCFLALGAVTILFFRQSREDGLAQRLVDSGVPADHVRTALRRGELDDLARGAGVALGTRAGID